MENVMTLQEKVNVFLDKLRESGAINMFGAAPYVSDTFGQLINQNEIITEDTRSQKEATSSLGRLPSYSLWC